MRDEIRDILNVRQPHNHLRGYGLCISIDVEDKIYPQVCIYIHMRT